MSNWTHVAGIVRIDCFLEDVGIEELFGKEIRWEDPSEIWEDAEEHPEKYLSMGSEGSLHDRKDEE